MRSKAMTTDPLPRPGLPMWLWSLLLAALTIAVLFVVI
jgi:hypothetical protein